MSDLFPATGSCSFQDIRAAIEDPSGLPTDLNSDDVRSLAGISFQQDPEGTISMNDFRGKGGELAMTVTGSQATWVSGDYRYYSFLASGQINITAGYKQFEIFLLGGGGGGGSGRHGGGGGSGAAQVGRWGFGTGTRQILVGAKGLEMPQWPGTSVWDPSANGTKGGDSGVTYSTAFAYGGGTHKDPKPGGSGAGENSADGGAGTGLGASGEVTTGGHPGGQGAFIPTGAPNQFVGGGGGGVTGAGGNAVVRPGGSSTCGRGGTGSNIASFLPGWVFPTSPGWTGWPQAKNSWGGGGAGSGGSKPTNISTPSQDGGGQATANTGGNATSYTGGGGGAGRFVPGTTVENKAGGNGAGGVVIMRYLLV